MATLVINCDGTANSFENNGNIRITYTAGGGSVTVTEIEGMRTDSYSSYEDASQTIKLTIGGVAKTISVTRVRFMASSAYATWGLTDTTWTGLSGKVDVVLSGLTNWSGAAYYNKTFSASSAIDAGYATYTITYNANGGTGAPSAQTKTHGTDLTLSSTKPTKSSVTASAYTVTFDANGGTCSTSSLTSTKTTSYTFSKWNTNSSGTGTSYSAGATFSTDANTTLYAIYTSSTSYGSITLPTPTNGSKTFLGWATADGAIISGTTYKPTASITLYAQWQGTPLIQIKDGDSWTPLTGTVYVKSGDSWVCVDTIKLKVNGDF